MSMLILYLTHVYSIGYCTYGCHGYKIVNKTPFIWFKGRGSLWNELHEWIKKKED